MKKYVIKDRPAVGVGPPVAPRVGLLRLERLERILLEAHKWYSKEPDLDTQFEEKAVGRRTQITTYRQNTFSHPCGTPACAIGHYAYRTPARWGWSTWGDLMLAPDAASLPLVFDISRNTEVHGAWRQVMHEFCISIEEVRELFETRGCGNAQTAKEAALYIRGFVARKRKELGIKKPKKRK